jgi:hypothetical protein
MRPRATVVAPATGPELGEFARLLEAGDGDAVDYFAYRAAALRAVFRGGEFAAIEQAVQSFEFDMATRAATRGGGARRDRATAAVVNDAADDHSTKPVVLIVDDTPENLTIMNGLLKDAYRTKVANSGERALNWRRRSRSRIWCCSTS